MRRVAELLSDFANERQVCRMDQKVYVARLAQRDVSVDQFRQRQPFIGHDFQTAGRQVIDDPNQLSRKKQGLVQVDLISLFERRALITWNGIFNFYERLIEKRLSAVPLREIEKNFPAKRLTQQCAESILFFAAWSRGTCG